MINEWKVYSKEKPGIGHLILVNFGTNIFVGTLNRPYDQSYKYNPEYYILNSNEFGLLEIQWDFLWMPIPPKPAGFEFDPVAFIK